MKDFKIILVGNGLIKNQGEFIDSFDKIYRFNNYVIEGFEYDVGTNTTNWVSVCSRLIECRMDKVWCPYHPSKERLREVKLFEQRTKCHVFMPSFNDCNKSLKGIDIVNPSTGFRFAMLIKLWGLSNRTTIIGFDGAKTGHYWNDKHKHAQNLIRQGQKEVDILKNNFEFMEANNEL